MNEIGFSYGMLCDDLEKQANEKGLTLGKQAEKFEKLRFSINMLTIHDILTDSQSDAMFKKLHKKVTGALKPVN